VRDEIQAQVEHLLAELLPQPRATTS
jgi:hypothetical protein